jgi:hypothetical protein
MQLVKAASRLGLAFAAVLATVVLTGCDAAYDVVIENHMDQEVTVSVAMREYRLGPCSVRIVAAVTAAPFGSIPLDIKDTDGNVIYSGGLEPQETGGLPKELFVRVPPEGPSECPAPVTGKFMLTVENYSEQQITVWLEGTLLGRVPALYTQSFEPLTGTWATARAVKVWDSQGRTLARVVKAEYILGGLPEIVVGVPAQ